MIHRHDARYAVYYYVESADRKEGKDTGKAKQSKATISVEIKYPIKLARNRHHSS